MSVGPMGGIASSVAGLPLAQAKGSEVERAGQEAVGHERKVTSQEKAERAGGIGETDGQDHETGERDADGRRLWERQEPPHHGEVLPEAERTAPRDTTGQAGNELDLSG